MNRLWVRLTLSQTLFLLVGIILITLLASQALEMVLRREATRQAITANNVAELLAAPKDAHGRGRGMGPMGQAMRGVIVADVDGTVLDNQPQNEERQLTALERRLAVPVMRDDKLVGYVLPMSSSALSQEFTSIMNALRTVMLAVAVAAGLWSLASGILVSESIAKPLRRLVEGVRTIASGDLHARITPSGPEETCELARAFNSMAASLQAGEDARRRLTADVAHELRTPLTVLQGTLSAMVDGVIAPGPEEIFALSDQVLRLNRLVGDLSEMARADAGQLALKLAPTDPVAILTNSASLFRPAMEAKGLALVSDWPSSLPPVQADAMRLGQVLGNLLSNTLRYTPAGGTVTLSATTHAQQVEFAVTDTGEGLTAREAARVFDRLYVTERSRSRETSGSGLGLAIARQLVLSMGGQMGVESTLGQGARFWLCLPVASALVSEFPRTCPPQGTSPGAA